MFVYQGIVNAAQCEESGFLQTMQTNGPQPNQVECCNKDGCNWSAEDYRSKHYLPAAVIRADQDNLADHRLFDTHFATHSVTLAYIFTKLTQNLLLGLLI